MLRVPFLLVLLAALAPGVEDAQPADPPRPVNRVCPVMGDPVSREIAAVVVEVERDGVKEAVAVGVCCEDCVATLADDPQRYARAALEDRKAPKKRK